ncbi:MAG: tRNA (guanosine(37)-N1)-methyltransferase TrmD [Clostridiales bacterium]
MIFDVLTIFPDMFKIMNESIMGIAQENGHVTINSIDIRDFSKNKHKKVDDYPYGGGNGMVMNAEPIYFAHKSIIDNIDYRPKVIYLTPQGKTLNQKMATEFSKEKHLILLCGHYEGIDERVLEEIVDEEISIGDYILTGGEIPAMVFIDCISRLVKGVLSNVESNIEESFYNGLLEYPQYTRPKIVLGKDVPEILLSGHHSNIKNWREDKSKERTKIKRPDMYEKYIKKDV